MFLLPPSRIQSVLILIVVCLVGGTVQHSAPPTNTAITSSYIVQAETSDSALAAVTHVGGTVTRRLAIINGVAAQLDATALARLRTSPNIALHADALVQSAGEATIKSALASASEPPPARPVKEPDTNGYLLYPAAATGADALHAQQVSTRKTICQDRQVTVSSELEQRPLQGWGVTVAVLDSGFMRMRSTTDWTYRDSVTGTLIAENGGRCIVYRDFLPQTTTNDNSNANAQNSIDQNGHGTHVISTIADRRATPLAAAHSATPVGVAPQVNLLVARVLDKDGAGNYGDVIAAIEWVINNRAAYNVQVLNLSLYAPVSGPYWADPLGQAVMRAWQAGITVVVAAGNAGSEAATITVPGNVPYVITVGAVKSGRYTQSGNDELAYYSSRGPTESAFIKPDVLVPASRTIAPMPDASTLAVELSEECVRRAAAGSLQPCIETKADVDYGIGHPAKQHTYFYLSGTSMAAAEVSGIVALILQANPGLTNDQVKQRLLSTARAAIDLTTNQPVYSPWEQGAGLIHTQQAVFTTTVDLANVGMDINLDLTTDTHYWGYTTWNDPPGEFRLIDPTTGEPLVVWDGASRAWAGGSRAWAGGSRAWAGGTTSWTGSISFWAGASRAWAGSIPETALSTASHSELLVRDSEFRILLPFVLR
jgi:subtilisin family serine protease